jgi:anti-anti-sigma factor
LAQLLKYSVDMHNFIKVINVAGTINVITSIKLINIVNLLTLQESIILNLESVQLITAAGLEALIDISTSAKEAGKRVVLLQASNDFKDLAEALDYYKFFIFSDNLDEAATKIKFFTN